MSKPDVSASSNKFFAFIFYNLYRFITKDFGGVFPFIRIIEDLYVQMCNIYKDGGLYMYLASNALKLYNSYKGEVIFKQYIELYESVITKNHVSFFKWGDRHN